MRSITLGSGPSTGPETPREYKARFGYNRRRALMWLIALEELLNRRELWVAQSASGRKPTGAGRQQ